MRFSLVNAGIAQLVEQLICNQQVVGSNPSAGSLVKLDREASRKICLDTFRTLLCSERPIPVFPDPKRINCMSPSEEQDSN